MKNKNIKESLVTQPKPETIRYFVDVLYSPKKWGNLEVVLDEQQAKIEATKWVDWLTANKHVWFEIKIVKETVTQEVVETYKSNNN